MTTGLQDHVTLFKEGTKGEQEGLNPLNFMPGEDMFMMAKQFDLSELPPVHIVEFKPLVSCSLSGCMHSHVDGNSNTSSTKVSSTQPSHASCAFHVMIHVHSYPEE